MLFVLLKFSESSGYKCEFQNTTSQNIAITVAIKNELGINNATIYKLCKLENEKIEEDYDAAILEYLNLVDDGNDKTTLGLYSSFIQAIPKSGLNFSMLIVMNSTIPNLHKNFICNAQNSTTILITKSPFQKIEDHTFESFKPLKNLVLVDNRISYIDEYAFTGLENLEILDLSFNSLRNLDKHVFGSLKSLQKIYISNNHIKFLDFKLTKSLNLKKVFFAKNEICYIKTSFFDHLTKIDEIDFYDNVCVDDAFSNLNGSLSVVHDRLTNCYENFKCALTCDNEQHDDYYLMRRIYCELSNNNTKTSENFSKLANTTLESLKTKITNSTANLEENFKDLKNFDATMKMNLTDLVTKLNEIQSDINRLEQQLTSFSKVAETAESDVKSLDTTNLHLTSNLQDIFHKNLTDAKNEAIESSNQHFYVLLGAVLIQFVMVVVLFVLLSLLIFKRRTITEEYTELTPPQLNGNQ